MRMGEREEFRIRMGWGRNTTLALPLALMGVLALVLAACAPADDVAEPVAEPDEEPVANIEEAEEPDPSPVDLGEEVILRFTWVLKGEYAPVYLAYERGYFAEEGVNISINEGAGSGPVLTTVGRGIEESAWGSGAHGVRGILDGVPLKVVGVYEPTSPIVYLSWPDDPVSEPADFEGRTLITSAGDSGLQYLPVFCTINDIDCDTIEPIVMDTAATIPQFLERRGDVISVFGSNELPIMEAEAGVEFEKMWFDDWGISLPGLSLIVNEEWMEENPDVVKGMLAALDRGYRDAYEDPEAAVDAILANWPDADLDREVVLEQVQFHLRALDPLDDRPIGWMDEEMWEHTAQLMLEAEIVEAEEVLEPSAYFTNRFLEEIRDERY